MNANLAEAVSKRPLHRRPRRRIKRSPRRTSLSFSRKPLGPAGCTLPGWTYNAATRTPANRWRVLNIGLGMHLFHDRTLRNLVRSAPDAFVRYPVAVVNLPTKIVEWHDVVLIVGVRGPESWRIREWIERGTDRARRARRRLNNIGSSRARTLRDEIALRVVTALL